DLQLALVGAIAALAVDGQVFEVAGVAIAAGAVGITLTDDSARILAIGPTVVAEIVALGRALVGRLGITLLALVLAAARQRQREYRDQRADDSRPHRSRG